MKTIFYNDEKVFSIKIIIIVIIIIIIIIGLLRWDNILLQSMSGIQISDEVVDYYSTDFKKQKKVVFFRCSLNAGGTQIVLKDSAEERDAVGVYQERTPEESKTRFDAMKGKLTIDDPCFVVFDFWFRKGERVENKMGVISW